MSFGEVDTLNMLFDKLETLFDESQGYYESFLDTNNMYKQGKLDDKAFFQRLGDYVVAYSALEFLSIKVIFEIRKSLKTGSVNTQSPGLMPGMGQPGTMGSPGMVPPRAGTAENPWRRLCARAAARTDRGRRQELSGAGLLGSRVHVDRRV